MTFTTLTLLAEAEVSWLYIGACLVVPFAWGLLTEGVFRLLARHFKHRKHRKDDHFLIEYHI
jgi:hypothetical protein